MSMIKKTLIAVVLGSLSFGAFAQQTGFISQSNTGYTQGGFNGPSPGTTNVQQAKSLRDDSWVVLEGNIVRQVAHEVYEFRDNSGSINVEIDDDRWQGQKATPTNKVRLQGEVDKDWNSVEIDVRNIQVLK